MESITPARTRISDRFPVASFNVFAPDTRYFEIACTTDPSLFHASHKEQRTSRNFFSSASRGLIRTSRQGMTYMVPPTQLQQFAGAKRLYYALATYGSPRGDDARFSIHPEALDRAPCITLSADFTGRTLDRGRVGRPPGATTDRYGAGASQLRWGGDDALEAAAASRKIANPNSYDDGFDAGLWEREGQAQALDDGGGDAAGADIEDDYDAPDSPDHSYSGDAAVSAEYGDLDAYGSAHRGYEDAPAAMAQGAHVQVVQHPGVAVDENGGGARRHHDENGYVDGHLDAHHDDHHSGDDGHYDAQSGDGGDPQHDELHRHHRRHHHGDHAEVGQAAIRPLGRAFGYGEEPSREPELPPGDSLSARSLDAAPGELSIPTKLHIVEVVAAAEAGDSGGAHTADLAQYSTVNPDTEFHNPANPAYHRQHIGLSFGLIQFTQRSGALGKVLALYRSSDPAEFVQVFGQSADDLVRVTNANTPDARLAPVGGKVLWDQVWTARFVEAGKKQGCRTAQRRVAVEAFIDPHLRIANWLGLDSERALAMLYDRCVHQGNGVGLAWVVRHAGPIQTQLQLEEALRTLGFDHLGAFQATIPYLEPSDGWGAATHAAMAKQLRALGASSPIPVPTLAQMLDRLVEAARNTDSFARVDRLRRAPDLSDAPLLLPDG